MKRTINRNWHNVISEIFANTKACKCFCLENGFRGDDCPKQVARNELQSFSSAKMRDNGDGTYTVKIHGNLWYRLYTV